MIKKILCSALITATVAAFASCGCSSGTVETRPPESVAVTPKTDTGQYASFVTSYKWINEKSGDTIDFNDNGTFSGKISGKSYDGTFTLKADKKNPGIVHSTVVLEGQKKERKWTYEFSDSAHMTVKTDKKNVSEDYAAEWTLETKEK